MLVCDKENYAAEVLAAAGPVLVDFFGDGCQPCAALLPHLERLEETYGGQIKFCKLNVSNARRLAIGQKVLGVPTVVLYQQGEKQAELVKEQATPEAVEAMINQYLPYTKAEKQTAY